MSTQATHHQPGFWKTYVFSTDHKIIGIQFLFTSMLMILVGGLMAMLLRWQLGWPGQPLAFMEKLAPNGMPGGIMVPEYYNMLFTMHGSFMIFFGVIPILVGAFGNYLIPLKIGAPDMAFPKMNMISYWLVIPSAAIMILGFFMEGGAASAGWTSYAPLSITLGNGQTCWLISLIILGTSSILGSINYITTIINLRAPGMSFFRMPLSVWALFITAIITLLATPALAGALALLLLDRTVGTSFFVPAGLIVDQVEWAARGGGQALLWQHLFWFYSHPAVYIMILPAFGIVSDILANFARKPVFGYRSMVYAIGAIAVLGFLVWAHHMFVSGMNPALGTSFMAATMVIAVPTGVKFFNWLATLWRGTIRMTTPMLHAVIFIAVFLVGGLTGIFSASMPVDVYIHDTYFIVGHLHYVLFGGSLFGTFAGITYWFPKMFGRELGEGLGKLHAGLSFIFFNAVMFPMFILGIHGMPRRIYDYQLYAHLHDVGGLNRMMSVSAFILFLVQWLFVINIFWSLWKGKKASENPWESTTLEWATSSPPPHGNFATIPTVYHGPYEYSLPGRTTDWLPQHHKA